MSGLWTGIKLLIGLAVLAGIMVFAFVYFMPWLLDREFAHLNPVLLPAKEALGL